IVVLLELAALIALGLWLWRHGEELRAIFSRCRVYLRRMRSPAVVFARRWVSREKAEQAISVSEAQDSETETRLGPFQIIRLLGSGTMTDVYEAVQKGSEEVVALKIPKPEWRNDQKYLARLFRQAKIGESLSHPNIIRVLGSGYADGTPYLAMERLHGITLRQILNQQPVLPVSRVIEISRAVTRALIYAHNHGVIHRDIKSENIMLTRENQAVVMDFDVAKATWRKGDTDHGTLLGTAAYMAPDQVTRGRADARSDLYSLGVTLFEMLTGRLPFEGDNFWRLLRQHRESSPPRLRVLRPDIPQEVEAVVLRLLEKSPERRYQSAQDLLDVLVSLQDVVDSVSKHHTGGNIP
ncbi:MAG: serine/threonine protein kinase, partial [Nitrospirae bacterium]|nr:serine/threonine protein kinase [Nitrospirota bacterium]